MTLAATITEQYVENMQAAARANRAAIAAVFLFLVVITAIHFVIFERQDDQHQDHQ